MRYRESDTSRFNAIFKNRREAFSLRKEAFSPPKPLQEFARALGAGYQFSSPERIQLFNPIYSSPNGGRYLYNDQAPPALPVSNRVTQHSDELIEEGNGALVQDRYADAVQFYTRALEANQKNADALNNRAVAYFCMGQWQETIIDVISCLVKQPKNFQVITICCHFCH